MSKDTRRIYPLRSRKNQDFSEPDIVEKTRKGKTKAKKDGNNDQTLQNNKQTKTNEISNISLQIGKIDEISEEKQIIRSVSLDKFIPIPMTSKKRVSDKKLMTSEEFPLVVCHKPLSQITLETENFCSQLKKINLSCFEIVEPPETQVPAKPQEAAIDDKRRNRIEYQELKKFSFGEIELAKIFIKNENSWRIKSKQYEAAKGWITPYVCNKIKARSEAKCPAKLRMIVMNGGDIIIETGGDHVCLNAEIESKRNSKVSPEIYEEIEALVNLKVTNSLDIQAHLKKKNLVEADVPNKEIRKAVEKAKTVLHSFHKDKIDYVKLEEWCKNHLEPENDNDAFVFDYYILPEQAEFRILITSVQLIKLVEDVNCWTIDGTYRLNRLSLPLIVFGVIDMGRHFHTLCHVLTSNETSDTYEWCITTFQAAIRRILKKDYGPKFVMTDNAPAIRKALESTMIDVDHGLCFWHFLKCVHKNMNKLTNKDYETDLLNDIFALRNAPDNGSYLNAAQLFLEKYEEMGENNMVNYLKQFWFDPSGYWHLAHQQFAPNTSGAIERHNRFIKTFQKRRILPYGEFLDSEMRFIKEMSKLYSNSNKIVEDCPRIEKIDWENAYKLLLDKTLDIDCYYLDTTNCFVIFFNGNRDQFIENTQKFKSFDEYAEKFKKIREIIVPNDAIKWRTESRCTCDYYFKHYMCPHILYVAICQKLIDLPNFVRKIPIIGQAQKGGQRKSRPNEALKRPKDDQIKKLSRKIVKNQPRAKKDKK